MTPQERDLVSELFDRLTRLEREPRDPEAERAIEGGLSRAPNAVYALVQSVLVQDEALKQADARIHELEAELYGPDEPSREPRGFLDNMREALFGGRREEGAGSVPAVRGRPMGAPPQFGTPMSAGQTQAEPLPSRGGSFLGTAAAAAAGMIGGGLLLDGIRSMLGGQNQGPFAGTFDRITGDGQSPWGSEAATSDLAQAAGLDDIGSASGENDRLAGLFDFGGDSAADDADDLSGSDDDLGDFDGSEDT